MKVCVNSRIYQEENAGVQNYIKNLYNNVLYIDSDNDYHFFQTNNKKKLGQIDYFKLPQNSFFSLLFDNILVSWLDFKYKPDLFHACANVLPIIRRKKCKYIVTIYDLAPLVNPHYSPSRLFSQYFKWSTYRSAKSADLIVTISKNTKNDLIKYFLIDPKKIKIIYPGINRKYFLENDSSTIKKELFKKYFFSVTTNPKRKNIISVLKVISQNKTFFSDYKYKIAGLIQGEELINITNIIKKNRLEGVVELLGYVNDNKLKNLYHDADFFIYPSFYEGFGLPLIEAMACKCLPLGANNSSMVEIMPDKRFLLNPYDLNDIFAKMKYIISMSHEEKQKIINSNYNYAKKFNWQVAAKKFINTYQPKEKIKQNSWHNYYKNTRYKMKISNIILHWQYILRIILLRPKKIMEAGCGPANHSIFIKSLLKNSSLYLLDSDKRILKEVKKKYNHRIKKYFNIDVLDNNKIKKIPKIDLVMSQGLFEHFNDDEFIQVLKNFSCISKKMIFSVPSENYGNKDFGNEVLRSKAEIESLVKKVNLKKYKIRYYFDIGIRTKLVQISKTKINLKNITRILFQSNHLLVEIEY